jgi:hypothetical protein
VYWECTITSLSSGYALIAAIDADALASSNPYQYTGWSPKSYAYNSSGVKTNNNSNTAYGASFTTGDIIGVAVDCTNGAIYFSKNNTWQNSGNPTSGASKTGAAFTWTGGTQNMISQNDVYTTGASVDFNFGQRPFTYTAPSGYKALCTQNLPTPTIGATTATQAGKFFNPVLYSGNSSTNTITGVGFQPDFTWFKRRDTAVSHGLQNSVTGVTKILRSDTTAAEDTYSGYIQSWNSDGFVLGSGDTSSNQTGGTYVSWNWRASNATAVSNTAGSITSTVSANTTAGFSIVTFSGNSTNGTVGHGLGAVPSMVIWKCRNQVEDWQVYHISVVASESLRLNTTAARAGSSAWQSTTPTSSVVYLGAGSTNQTGQNNLLYCFAPIAGYSAFGGYTGNGSTDGPVIFTNMRPAYMMVKRTDSTGDWYVVDNTRSPSNVVNLYLAANTSGAEGTYTLCDFLSNGFKMRNTSTEMNASGGSYIYMAFASNPFKYSLAR